MVKFLVCLLQLVISPGKGWEAIAEADEEPRRICADGFYPLIGIVACTVFIKYFYFDDLTLSFLLQDAVITFVKYFITYFFASFLFSVAFPSITEGEVDEKRYNTFIIYNLSILAVIGLIGNCLPMELSIVQFLPVFVIFTMWMGTRYLSIKDDKKVQFILLSVVSVLVPPYLIGCL